MNCGGTYIFEGSYGEVLAIMELKQISTAYVIPQRHHTGQSKPAGFACGPFPVPLTPDGQRGKGYAYTRTSAAAPWKQFRGTSLADIEGGVGGVAVTSDPGLLNTILRAIANT